MSISTLTEAWPRRRASSESKLCWNAASTDVAPERDPQKASQGCWSSHLLESGRRSRLHMRNNALMRAINRCPQSGLANLTRRVWSLLSGQQDMSSHFIKSIATVCKPMSETTSGDLGCILICPRAVCNLSTRMTRLTWSPVARGSASHCCQSSGR
eukprot:3196050-Pyramimonas_sp.AAC.1